MSERMPTLEINQFELLKSYYDLLQTIQEGLLYVEASFDDENKTEGDRVLGDVLEALSQLEKTNEQLLQEFAENRSFTKFIEQYQPVLNAVLQLEGHMNDMYEKQRIINGDILPLFEKWKTRMEQQIQPYITH
ncbi:hypothetical protein [Metabacillus iocasae]|uniref:DUF8042 domain-containing protein n=1 Tax=Priestia iocasae TaxID=2291674 RepID=A0ABS2QZP1_9BACI|nr:hypothetical protein [Metabacillus iocasae]MBM7704482.1 hypothetical protein [Metabacillus iocasae]